MMMIMMVVGDFLKIPFRELKKGNNVCSFALLLLFKTCLVPNWHCQYLQLGFNDPAVKRTWQSPAECLHPPALLLFHTAHKNHLHEDLIRESKKVFHIWLFHLREDLIRESEKIFPPHPPPPPRHLPSRESRRRLGWKGRLNSTSVCNNDHHT